MKFPVQILPAPSILGLRPSGVERLGERLLAAGLADKLKTALSVLMITAQNDPCNSEGTFGLIFMDAHANFMNRSALQQAK